MLVSLKHWLFFMDDTGVCSLTIFTRTIFMQARHLPNYSAQAGQLVQHFLRHIGYNMFVPLYNLYFAAAILRSGV